MIKKIKNKKFLIYLTIVLVVLLAIYMNTPLDIQTIPTSFIAGENPGFDLTLGQLNFGKIIPGSSSTRSLSIANTYDHSTTTTIKSSGQISKYLVVSQSNFILQPNQSKNITFSCYPEKEIELKEYSGEIIITSKRTNPFS